jgi:hypothetical protein
MSLFLEEGAQVMSPEPIAASLDLIRWTFTIDPAHRAAIEEHLSDLGLDVLVRDDCKFLATWDEPDRDVDEVITTIWELNGAPFEVTQEEFQRSGLHILHHVEDEGTQEAA